MIDQYNDKIKSEIEYFSGKVDIHGDLPSAYSWWSKEYVEPILKEVMGVTGDVDMYSTEILKIANQFNNDENLRFVSIGCGEARVENAVCLSLLKAGVRNFRFNCLDLSSEALSRGKALAVASGVSDFMDFSTTDLSQWIPECNYHAVLATQFLHHVENIERLFDNIKTMLTPGGIFATVDMIGRNGHQLWPEALGIVDAFWENAPKRLKYNNCLGRYEEKYSNWDNSKECFEGIRSQDILSNLILRFKFAGFVAVGNIAPTLFGRHFGHNYQMDDLHDKQIVRKISQIDFDLIDIGYLKPILMYAVMKNEDVNCMKVFRHWTPEFCCRNTRILDEGISYALTTSKGNVIFGERCQALCWLTTGWSSAEPNGVWSNAKESNLEIPIEINTKNILCLVMSALGDIFPPKTTQTVKVYANSQYIREFTFKEIGKLEQFQIKIPIRFLVDNVLKISFTFSDIRSRRDLGDENGDLRHTAMFLHSLRIE